MAGHKLNQLEAFYRQLHDTLAEIPGVASVSESLHSPMDGDNWEMETFIEGQAPPPPGSNQNVAAYDRVSAGYFGTIGSKIIAGRAINDQDTASTQSVAVINRAFMKHFFKDGNPIGRHIGIEDQKYAGSLEIVGVSEDTHYQDPTSKVDPMFFVAGPQRTRFSESSNYYSCR